MRRLLLAVLTLFTASAYAQPVDPVAGTYTLSGTNLGGSGTYGGTLEVEPTGQTYRVTWRVETPTVVPPFVGVGILSDSVLAVTYGDPACRIAVYGIGENRSFNGTWAQMGATKTNFELLVNMQNGTATVLGSLPGSSGTYNGQATIRATGDTFDIRWMIGETSYNGTGVGTGNHFAFAYGSPACWVVAYNVSARGLGGLWTYRDRTDFATESALRR